MGSRPHFHFVTLFPEIIDVWFSTSIPGRAAAQGVYSYEILDLREFGIGAHRSVDDKPYGGGSGMVLRVEPLVAATESVWERFGRSDVRVVCFSPGGERITHDVLGRIRSETRDEAHFVLICGHYEGIDQRFLDHWVDLELSLGDFVVTGGELAAMAFVDGYIRGLDGTLCSREAFEAESFAMRDEHGEPLLEHPHYTRPAKFRSHEVPAILLGGNHGRIADWRRDQARERTVRRRVDAGSRDGEPSF